MRRALSLFAATVVMLVGVRASATDAGVDGSTAKDSGIGTTPSPGNPVVPADSDAGDAGDAASSSSGGDSSGCRFVAQRSEGWSTALGLVAAASIFVMSRRRRTRR